MRCPGCNSEMTCRLGEYHYQESGLDNLYLTDVEIWRCSCGEEVVGIPNLPGLHDLIARAIVHKKSLLSGREIRFLRKNLALPAKELASLLGVDPATVSRWENGKQTPGPLADRCIRMVYAGRKDLALDELMEVFSSIHPDGELPLPLRLTRREWAAHTPGSGFCGHG